MTKQIELFESKDGKIRLDVNLKRDTVWLTQKQMAILFDCSIDNISLHLKNIFKEEELNIELVVEDSSNTAKDGKVYKTKNYSLDAVLSVGYRVKSKVATQFRQWSTSILKEHLVNGYSVNSKRLIEKKLELEIKESRKIVAQVLILKGLDKSLDETNMISTYLGKTVDQETMVLKAHILVERFLIQFLKSNSKNGTILDESRFTFRHLLSIVRLQYNPKEKLWLWGILKKLNTLRNKYAHVLETEEIDTEIRVFQRDCLKKLRSLGIESDKEDLKSMLVHLCAVVYGELS